MSNKLAKVTAGPCDPVFICNTVADPIPIVGDVTVVLTESSITPITLCDNNGPFIRVYTVTETSTVTTLNTELDGTPYVTVGTVLICPASGPDVEQRLFCDDNAGVITPFINAYEYDDQGNIIAVVTTLIDGVTPYVPSGIIRVCAGEDGDVEVLTLCDDANDNMFLRHIVYDNTGTVLGTTDTLLDASTLYVLIGNARFCAVQEANIINPANLIPNSSGNHDSIEIDNAITTFTGEGGALDAATTHVFVRFELGAVRVTFNGDAPTAGISPPGTGILYKANDSGLWKADTLLDARFIRNDAVNGWLQISEFMPGA